MQFQTAKKKKKKKKHSAAEVGFGAYFTTFFSKLISLDPRPFRNDWFI
jgi:hypothetical protein